MNGADIGLAICGFLTLVGINVGIYGNVCLSDDRRRLRRALTLAGMTGVVCGYGGIIGLYCLR